VHERAVLKEKLITHMAVEKMTLMGVKDGGGISGRLGVAASTLSIWLGRSQNKAGVRENTFKIIDTKVTAYLEKVAAAAPAAEPPEADQEPAVEPTAAARTAAAAPTAAPAAAPSRKRARTAATARTEPPSAAPRRAAAPRGAPAPAPAPVVPALPDELMFCSRCDRRMGGLRTATHSGCGADEAWCTCD
tara:strand:- start:29 stop:598 length:570 start_codon:yes stop_codon:yes gene_type:complete